ncbi:MAG TPA: hypothetical protein VKQ72_19950 [Aggregatilineales bacterium]|nr:hypothetical protein [Aggregatilineales bacterium]
MKFQRVVLIVLIIGSCLLIMHPLTTLRADGAPPPYPQGSSIGPTVPTQVRMVSETVTITVHPLSGITPATAPDADPIGVQNWMNATVEATFTLRNLGREDEAFAVWFPLTDSEDAADQKLTIGDFAAWVNRQSATITTQPPHASRPTPQPAQTATASATASATANPTGTPAVDLTCCSALEPDWYNYVPWATWPVTFPVGKDVLIRVTYTQSPRGFRPSGDFTYILQTSAGWKDTLGDGTVTLKLPYPVSFENVGVVGWLDGYDYQISGDQITWHFTDLKPTALKNISICVIEPDIWTATQNARRAVEKSPDSVATWFQYALAEQRLSQQGADGSYDCDSAPNDLELDVTSILSSRMNQLAPADRQNLYVKYTNWLLHQGTPGDLLGKIAYKPGYYKDRAALLAMLSSDFKQWPDDPVFLLVQHILQSPDFLSYTNQKP